LNKIIAKVSKNFECYIKQENVLGEDLESENY